MHSFLLLLFYTSTSTSAIKIVLVVCSLAFAREGKLEPSGGIHPLICEARILKIIKQATANILEKYMKHRCVL